MALSVCNSCGQEFRTKYLRRGMCKSCNRLEDESCDDDIDLDVSSPAEQHDRAYNGDELPDVEYED